MDKIQDYINQFEHTKKQWLEQLVLFMREETQLEECFDYKMPTYKSDGLYIAFASQKNYFSFYTNEESVLESFKDEIPSTSLGKSCARIKYTESEAIKVMIQVIKDIMLVHNITL